MWHELSGKTFWRKWGVKSKENLAGEGGRHCGKGPGVVPIVPGFALSPLLLGVQEQEDPRLLLESLKLGKE